MFESLKNMEYIKRANNIKESKNRQGYYSIMGECIGILKRCKKNADIICDLYSNWDNIGSIPKELGEEIEELLKNDDYLLCIHRTGGYFEVKHDDVLNSDLLNNIFSQGLKNYGHINAGGFSNSTPDPCLTVSPIDNMLTACMFLKGRYKDSAGGVLLYLPKAYVDDEAHMINNSEDMLYDFIDGVAHIKKEYLIGYVDNEDGVCTYYDKSAFNKNIKDSNSNFRHK